MSPLWQELHALRTPDEVKSQPEELHYHITKNILPFLDRLTTRQIILADDKTTQDLLQHLEPSTDTLPYLYILLAQIRTTVEGSKNKFLHESLHPDGQLWERVVYFISQFDPVEIRYARSRWVELITVFDLVTSYGETAPVLQHMAQAILRLDPSGETLTDAHLLFLRLCLRTGTFVDARYILDCDVHNFPTYDHLDGLPPCTQNIPSNAYITVRSQLTTKITTEHALEYHLLGAMILIGLQDWESASYYLEHLLQAPTHHVAHGYMLEAYKKWVLVQLLLHGKISASTRSINAAALKNMRAAAKPYDAVVEAFKAEKGKKLHAEIYEAQQIYVDDGNMGLASQVLERHRELSIVRLGKIYAVVPLSHIESTLGIDHAEALAYVQSLVQKQRIDAEIQQSQDMGSFSLRFRSDSSRPLAVGSEEQMRMDLGRQAVKIKALSRQVEEADRRLGLSKEYLSFVARQKKNADGNHGSPGAEGMDMSFAAAAASDEDESIMEL